MSKNKLFVSQFNFMAEVQSQIALLAENKTLSEASGQVFVFYSQLS